MKVLLITNYWFPWNNAGTMRWLHFGKYLDFDVLTSNKPRNSMLDFTLPDPQKKVCRFGNNLPAVVWGFVAPFVALTKKYDVYIVTCPPESLLIGAYVLQLFGKKVLVDMRDSIKRERQPIKWLVPVYQFFYNKIKHAVVCWKFISPDKPVVYHGHESVPKVKYVGSYNERVNYASFIQLLKSGLIPDQHNKPNGYASQTIHTLLYLGFPISQNAHPEAYTIVPRDYKYRSAEMKAIINKLTT